ncbi:RHH-type proline utilization regulon transcriptional repressor/proline dehydrogenase/delta 1-pyrroline-5-carboxylate dehydrogenase [Microbacterium endophyticum]|uniref:L-glutamate gamma-semialdehyde dehydrogenase n=1 Tax=Microbacterium endophyticum TaxID=1526412 RepID=A0A7W4YM39_9MICO|nr:proline dehydrogenase family protein [Microbacterium endophyticum]MBB2975803.1 RHH-type proline utilization regulon transcriptional repressor/proline dehydrogenase/delta 1-pyrroline-5-carboxylate dehydrogenase [Microbacterium endophyticum]NIK36286.1 RHH-type proline utilization regulon transcriptional repressor/proline dehydrogenase/delta 1-pyrroline-5-carboxylate dehydrogenase [Microbacterium endophyticum]
MPNDHADFAANEELAERAIALAERWVRASSGIETDASAQRLADVLRDPQGLPFTVGFVDGVMRPESLTAAATQLRRIAPLVPDFLPWHLRGAVHVGGAMAPIMPSPVVPIARRVLREMVGHLIVDARPEKLGPALTTLRGRGHRLNVNLLGEAVLGENEAKRRLDGIHALIRRPDVDYVSVKVSAIASHISMWAFDDIVDSVVERLLPLYVSALPKGGPASMPTFINLDMEEYRDLDLTIAVFTRLLEDERFTNLEAGIVLQAYLPDALPALQQLTAWARSRVDAGGAPIKVRLVKGANLAMERVDAVMHGWEPATYSAKVDSDANYLRCLEWALRPKHTRAVLLGVAGHNLFDIAYAWLLAGEQGVRDAVDFEMLLGMAQAQMETVSADVGQVLLYVPVVAPDEFDVAISYLVRRLEESASSENFLSAAFDIDTNPELLTRERDRFLASVERAADPALLVGARRTANRRASTATEAASDEEPRLLRDPVDPATQETGGLTQAVLGIARGAEDGATDAFDPAAHAMLFGGEEFVETAVFSMRESGTRAVGAPGFANSADSDPALSSTRDWAREIFDGMKTSTLGDDTIAAAYVGEASDLEAVISGVKDAAGTWGAMPAADRAAVLLRAADKLEERRAQLIEVAASETGKVLAEGDVEVSEAIDFARYYAATARELDRVSGAVFVPSRVIVVTPPWNFPLAIPAGGVLAALAAGSGVVFKPAPQARRCAAVIAEALWDAGVPRDLLALVDLDEDGLGQQLVSHPAVDRVILTGGSETAELFRSWRHDLPLLAETSGKNSMIVMPSADLDLAASDVVKSAFGHAGQKCSAASLVILVGSVGRSKRFARQLVDATKSLHIGPPWEPRVEVGPVIEAPRGKLAWALSELDEGERWLIKPTTRDDVPEYAGRLWNPGIRVGVQPRSRFHREEFFGPVLGVMHASTLAEAIELQNAVAYGLTAGLYTQNPDELEQWLARVQAGNLYVNRGITGAIVQRQPFGGWKRSSVGAGTKAGGPNYLIGLGSWRATNSGALSTTLHLRGLDSRITDLIEAAQPALGYEEFEWLRRGALSDAVAWNREFGQVKDVSRLEVERNLFRYRPVQVALRAIEGASLQEVLRVVLAGLRAGSAFSLSASAGLPPRVRRVLDDNGISVFVETEAEWLERIAGSAPERVRIIGETDAAALARRTLAETLSGNIDVAIYANEVTTAGRIELLPFLHEQAIAITAHRFGTPDNTFSSVI